MFPFRSRSLRWEELELRAVARAGQLFCNWTVELEEYGPQPQSLQFTEWILENTPEHFHSWIVQTVPAQVQKSQMGRVRRQSREQRVAAEG